MGTIRALGAFGPYATLAATLISVPAGIVVFLHGRYHERLSAAILLALLISPHNLCGDCVLTAIIAFSHTNRFIRYAILLPWAYFAPVMWPMIVAGILFLVLMAVDAVRRKYPNLSWQAKFKS